MLREKENWLHVKGINKKRPEVKLIFKSFLDFFRDGGPLLAGSVAYFFLMSFVPFGLLLISLLGYFLGENGEFFEFFSARLLRFFPAATSEISKQLTALVVYKRVGIFTFIIYAYFSYQFYMTLESAVRNIFKQKEKRPFFISVFFSIFIITLIAVLIVVSFAATSAIQMLHSFLEVFPVLGIGKLTVFFIKFVMPVFVIFIVASFLYKFLPGKKVSLRHAFRGAFFTSVFLEIARHLFTLYVITAAAQYGAIYGSLSTFVIFLLWVFYSACIFLIGAEIVCNLSSARLEKKSPTSGRSRV
ncbi:MAG: YihY/virulence factor BrkB family protein [Deltaproteobacteria bacterium]|nr:YihY/virulence factor BrkB family protein [Deltaproteobacteria bacterium]